MAINDAKRREMKRKVLFRQRMELEISREKGRGVNFTSYMEVGEYEPTLVEEELQQACVELNILNNMLDENASKKELREQVHILHSLIRPRGYLQQKMSDHSVNSIEQLIGVL